LYLSDCWSRKRMAALTTPSFFAFMSTYVLPNLQEGEVFSLTSHFMPRASSRGRNRIESISSGGMQPVAVKSPSAIMSTTSTGEMPVCQIFVDEQPVILYNDTQELNTVLIQSGGGTGPMKPGNRHAVRDQVPIPARQVS